MQFWIVSILVFLELALGHRTAASPGASRPVSILVFLELALGRLPGHAKVFIGVVSILVFLELALGRQMDARDPGHGFLFQSLFSWNSPSDHRLQGH